MHYINVPKKSTVQGQEEKSTIFLTLLLAVNCEYIKLMSSALVVIRQQTEVVLSELATFF